MAIEPTSRPDAPVDAPIGGVLIEHGKGPVGEFETGGTTAVGPWKLAWRRLRRNKTAIVFMAIFVLIVVLCLLAPVYSNDIAHIGPNQTNVTGTIKLNGKVTNVVSTDGNPIGPTWTRHYLLGADEEGRDVAVRLLYGGRVSLLIGAIATVLIIVLGTLVGVLCGFF